MMSQSTARPFSPDDEKIVWGVFFDSDTMNALQHVSRLSLTADYNICEGLIALDDDWESVLAALQKVPGEHWSKPVACVLSGGIFVWETANELLAEKGGRA